MKRTRTRRSSGTRPSDQRPKVQRIGDRVVIGIDTAQAFLDSPSGRRLRKYLAAGLIVTAPLLFRIPGLKRYPLVRTLELIGGAALVVKFAEAIRDWEPGSGDGPVVVDVPPSR